MKIVATIIFTFLIGLSAQSQEIKKNIEEVATTVNVKELKLEKENNVARLYMFKNYRVTKALSFRTKRNKAKLA